MAKTHSIEVGDFIEVPAWRTMGQVVDVMPADLGSEDAVCVLLQERPEAEPRRYRLEPDEFNFVD